MSEARESPDAAGDAVALARSRSGQRLADIVHAQILRLISRGEFPKDFKLPPETDLAVRFGVSRPIVRDALARLRADGYVRSQRGSGTVVVRGAAPTPAPMPVIRTVADLLRSYEFRLTVEGATASLAAERRTSEDLAKISEALDRAGDLLSADMVHLLPDANFAFHRAVVQATHNPYYIAAVEGLPNFVGRNMLDFGGLRVQPLPRAHRIQEEHRAIFAAIAAGEAEQAKLLMERHIISARDAVLERQVLTFGPVADGGSLAERAA